MRVNYLLQVIVILCVSIPPIVAHWGEWAAGAGGIHNRPVFQFAPSIRWNFTDSTRPITEGVIFVRDEDGAVIFANGRSTTPMFWIISPDGTTISSWNSTTAGHCLGTLTYRNGIIYAFDDDNCNLFAIMALDGSTLWTLDAKDLCDESNRNSASAIHWKSDNSVFYISSSFATQAINPTNGDIIWRTRTTDPSSWSYFLHPIPTPDGNLVFHDGSNSLYKLAASNGQIIWSVLLSNLSDNIPPAPTVDYTNGNVYVNDYGGNVYGFGKDGNMLWKTTIAGAKFRVGSPVLIDPQYIIVADTTCGCIYAISTTTGAYSVTFNTGLLIGISSQMVWSSGVLYVIYDNAHFVAYDTANLLQLKVLWSLRLPVRITWGGGPSIGLDGTIYISSDDTSGTVPNLVSVGCLDSKVVSSDGRSCVDPPVKTSSATSAEWMLFVSILVLYFTLYDLNC